MTAGAAPHRLQWRRQFAGPAFAMILLLAVVPSLRAGEAADSGAAATPYRPSVSSPAALSEPGWIDMEIGWQRAQGGGDRRRDSVPVTAKLAFNPDWGLVLGGEVGVRRTDSDDVLFTGGGDITLLLKHRIPTASEATAWGWALGAKFPTANADIGSGKSDLIATGIFSTDFGTANHFDANLTATRLGAWGEGESRTQAGWAAAMSHGLNDRWGVFVEPSGAYRRGTAATAQILVGASYSYSTRTVFDVAAAKGLTDATPDWQAMLGVTFLLARLW